MTSICVMIFACMMLWRDGQIGAKTQAPFLVGFLGLIFSIAEVSIWMAVLGD
jgi:hypothetical protein